jgi:hypothetical protein
MNTIQKRQFTAPNFQEMLFQKNQQMLTQGIQAPQINPADFNKRYADFLEMDAEDKQDYLETLQIEAQSNENAMNFFCFLMNQQGQICQRDAEIAAKKKRQQNTIIFIVVMVVIAVGAWYFLFKK